VLIIGARVPLVQLKKIAYSGIWFLPFACLPCSS
jgi:hypothetical protein